MRHAYGHPVNLRDISAHANLSPYHFLRVYKRAYGETPQEFLTRLRLERAKTLLARGSHNVMEACFEVGFFGLGSFSTLFAGRVGLSPSQHRRYARSTTSVPAAVRALFVPSCFFTMLYGTPQERNFGEAEKSGCRVRVAIPGAVLRQRGHRDSQLRKLVQSHPEQTIVHLQNARAGRRTLPGSRRARYDPLRG